MALAALHKSLDRQLMAIAQRISGSRESAQEIVCDVLLFVWNHARIYDVSRGSVQAWLNAATRSRAIDRVRSARRHCKVAASLHDETDCTEQLEQGGGVFFVTEQRAVSAALAGLTPLRQELLRMAYFDGLTQAEIAAQLRLPVGTVKSHMRRALDSVRKLLRPAADAGHSRHIRQRAATCRLTDNLSDMA